MKIFRQLTIMLVLAMTSLAVVAEALPSAQSVVKQSVETMKKAPAIEAKFSATFGNSSTSGTILLSGNKFALTTGELSTWFDGHTQWAYSASSQEVNISEPTLVELEQINPFAVMQSVQKNYSPRRVKAPAGFDRIELLPFKGAKTQYAKVVLTINSTTHFPSQIDVTARDGALTSIKVKAIKSVKVPAASAFSFNKSLYPNADIIDLR